MKLRVIALDYDGTIASDGRADAEVLAAVAAIRQQGLVVMLVTGRILEELRTLLSTLRLFDAVVAENGAVVSFPPSGASLLLGAPPPPAFLAELRRQSLPVRVGRCVVELDADAAPAALAIIRKLELPLVLHFNRNRAMVLPQTVSKATGLRAALKALRLSPHNALAIGDAENDHELLACCELGVAVGWGSKVLQAAADSVLTGSSPRDVAAWLRTAAQSPRCDLSRVERRQLVLGRYGDGTPAFLHLRGRNILIAGDPRSGKSWLAGLIAEQLVLKEYLVCVIDPEGDYATLGALPGVQVAGGDDPLPSARDLARVFAHPDASLVIDLSRLTPEQRRVQVAALLPAVTALRRQQGVPQRLLVDEAHDFLHEPAAAAAFADGLGGCTLVTYRVSALHRDVLAASEAVFVTRETDAREAAVLRELCRGVQSEAHWQETLAALELSEAALLPGAVEAQGLLRRFRLAPRITHHVRHEHKYLDVPMPDDRAFRFAPLGGLGERLARSLREFVEIVDATPTSHIDDHLRRGDFSRWVAHVFHDPILAARLRAVEERYCLGQLPDVNGALIQAIRERYRTPEEAAWQTPLP